jgi:hypothetical protein
VKEKTVAEKRKRTKEKRKKRWWRKKRWNGESVRQRDEKQII